MKQLTIILAILATCMVGRSAEVITTTINILNAPIGNTNTLTISGSTRTFTNDVTATPGTLILETNSIPYSATNILDHLTAYRPSTIFFLSQDQTTNVIFKSLPGVVPSVSLAGGWGSVTYQTNTVGIPTFNPILPITVHSATNQTNMGSMLAFALSKATNALAYHWPVLSQTAGLTNNNTFTGTNSLTRGGWNLASITNLLTLSGVIGAVTNGTFEAPTLEDPVMTNGVNYGNAFRSDGSGTSSLQLGASATATGTSSTAVGNSADASAQSATAIGNQAVADGFGSTALGQDSEASNGASVAIGSGAVADATNSISIGFESAVVTAHTNSIALGASAATTAKDQIMLGASTHVTVVPGRLEVSGTQTNSILTGPTKIGVSGGPYGTMSISRYNLTTLAAGPNLIDINGASYVKVSGAGADFSIDAITNSAPSGVVDGMRVMIQNSESYTMTIADASGASAGVAANRLLTGTGADASITNNPGSFEAMYDSAASRWVVIGQTD